MNLKKDASPGQLGDQARHTLNGRMVDPGQQQRDFEQFFGHGFRFISG